jgi:UDP-N-acetylglucosamine--N-acetylmuramyl-(pentapeptide) pyrophosphoryl-undecaprenol N-acetylglucosamine transferase
MNFLFVCGGSAGHINPALAIAEELRRKMPESGILFVGADKTLEKRLIPEAGFGLINIRMSGLRRGFSPGDILHNIVTTWNLFTASVKSKILLEEYRPDAVIGTGGYINYPVLKKAAKMGIATYVLEPNAYPGLAVRMLSSIVDKIFVTYVYTGTPLRSEFLEKTSDSEKDAESTSNQKERPLVVSFWGSLGAANMNNIMLDLIKQNVQECRFNHIHATGISSSAEVMKARLKDMGVTEIKPPLADIRGYIDDMSAVMRDADIVVSRAGASTIVELTSSGKPAVLIPSPNVTENHQEENAKQLQEAGGAVMIVESECTGELLFDTVTSLLKNTEKLERMSKALKTLSVRDAAARIVDIILGDAKIKNRS